jgi:hypothetical protein
MTARRWLISLRIEILVDEDITDAERRLHFLELVHDLNADRYVERQTGCQRQ